MIKKVVVRNLKPKTDYWVCAFQFFDENENYIDVSSGVTSSTTIKFESDNCIVTSKTAALSSGTSNYALSKMMQHPRPSGYAAYSLGASNTEITIEWKEGILVSSFNYALKHPSNSSHRSADGAFLEFYDAEDVLLETYILDSGVTSPEGVTVGTPELTSFNEIKHLIKADNKIHTLSEDMSVLTYPELTEPLTFEDYGEWGMDDLNGYEKPIEWVKRPMDEGEKVGEGRIVRKTVDKSEFVINSLEVK